MRSRETVSFTCEMLCGACTFLLLATLSERSLEMLALDGIRIKPNIASITLQYDPTLLVWDNVMIIVELFQGNSSLDHNRSADSGPLQRRFLVLIQQTNKRSSMATYNRLSS